MRFIECWEETRCLTTLLDLCASSPDVKQIKAVVSGAHLRFNCGFELAIFTTFSASTIAAHSPQD